MIFQAYDFLELYRRHGCELQFGGSDQWGNIVNGNTPRELRRCLESLHRRNFFFFSLSVVNLFSFLSFFFFFLWRR